MTITHHLGAESLMSYAAGAMPAALSALAGAHIAMCHHCRRELTLFEHVGGALLQSLAPIPAPIRFCCSRVMISKASAGGASVSVYGTGLCRCGARAHCSSSRRRPAPRFPIMATPAASSPSSCAGLSPMPADAMALAILPTSTRRSSTRRSPMRIRVASAPLPTKCQRAFPAYWRASCSRGTGSKAQATVLPTHRSPLNRAPAPRSL